MVTKRPGDRERELRSNRGKTVAQKRKDTMTVKKRDEEAMQKGTIKYVLFIKRFSFLNFIFLHLNLLHLYYNLSLIHI